MEDDIDKKAGSLLKDDKILLDFMIQVVDILF
jgi:hypothetical protein